jgi:dUTP pyrophosphatase
MIRIKLLYPESRLPRQSNIGSAAFDLYARTIGMIPAYGTSKIPLGIATEFSLGFVCLIKGRSGLAARGIHPIGGVVDSNFRGEWEAIVCNTSWTPFYYNVGDRVAQFIMQQVFTPSFKIVDELEESERGVCGFGSTGA